MSLVLSNPEFVAALATFGICVVLLDLLGRRRGVSEPQRRAALSSVVGNGVFLFAAVGTDGAFGVATAPPLPRTATTVLYVVAVLSCLRAFVWFVRWGRSRASDGDAAG